MPSTSVNASFGTRFITLVLLLFSLLAVPAAAQESQPNNRDRTGLWGLGLEGGVMKLIEGEWDYSTVDQFGGFHLDRGLTPQWNLSLAFQYGHVRPGPAKRGESVGTNGASSAPLYTVIKRPMIKLQHRFAPASTITPVLGVGLGVTKWRVVDTTGQVVGWHPTGDTITGNDINGNTSPLASTDFTFELDLGLDLALTHSLAFNLGGRYAVMPGNELDNIGMSHYWGPDHVDANTALVTAYVGLTWWFGGGDSDHDGVPNDRDQCPNEPEDRDGYNDSDGCPDPDNDGDGILDGADACPTRAEDLDGYQDDDGCPDPDNDGDGIRDERDQCPDEAEDIDGWQDRDGCPDPDNDLDGVPDTADQCPHTPADSKVDANGCAIEVPSATTSTIFVPAPVTTEVLKDVTFISGGAELTPGSIDVLIDLANELDTNPELAIEIRGHTDATGNAEANRILSQRRATAVLNTLVDMGIDPARLQAVGYGEDYPIADNSTAAGRARNRRVEIQRQ